MNSLLVLKSHPTMVESVSSSTRNIDDDEPLSDSVDFVSYKSTSSKHSRTVSNSDNLRPYAISAVLTICAITLWIIAYFVIVKMQKQYDTSQTNYIRSTNPQKYMKSIETRKRYRKLLHEIISINSNSVEQNKVDTIVRTISPEWKALQWMVSDDPLALKFSSLLDSLLQDNDHSQTSVDNAGYVKVCDSIRNSTMINACERLVQRHTLATLYYASAGNQVWNNLSPKSGWVKHVSAQYTELHHSDRIPFNECDWLGVNCSSGSIHTINISQSLGFILTGMTFPVSLAKLSKLEFLDISTQGLKGRLPDRLYSGLSNLKHLDLSRNRLSRAFNGDFDSINKLNNLEVLSVMHNGLIEILPTLSSLSSLRIAKLEGNRLLQGNFWNDSARYWSQIEHIDISYTSLGGAISDLPEIQVLKNLVGLHASQCELTGTLPPELGTASNLESLVISEVGESRIAGTIPTEYGNFQKLKYAVLDGLNGIEGSLPSELGRWGELKFLTLKDLSKLSSTIPTEWGGMTSLQNLQILSTNILGTIPTELGKCSLLRGMVLVDTRVTGIMPTELCSLRKFGMYKLETDCSNGTILCDTPDCCTSCFMT